MSQLNNKYIKISIHLKPIIRSVAFCFIVLFSIHVSSQTIDVPEPIKVTGKLIVHQSEEIAGEVIVACPAVKENRNCAVILNED